MQLTEGRPMPVPGKEVTIVTDGACAKNPGRGGWACILKFGEHEKVLQGSEPETTNNRMELMAVIQGFQALKEPVHARVITDSKYVVNAFEQRWLDKWKRNGWKTNSGPVKNQDLWETLLTLVASHRVEWVWVKAHTKGEDDLSVLNARADKLAQQEAGTWRGKDAS